jgi:hypothetical protein
VGVSPHKIFLIKLYEFVLPFMCTTCCVHLILPDSIIVAGVGEEKNYEGFVVDTSLNDI